MSQIITIATVVFMCALLIVGLYFLYKKTRLKMIQRIQYSREFNKVGVYEGQRVTFTTTVGSPCFSLIWNHGSIRNCGCKISRLILTNPNSW